MSRSEKREKRGWLAKSIQKSLGYSTMIAQPLRITCREQRAGARRLTIFPPRYGCRKSWPAGCGQINFLSTSTGRAAKLWWWKAAPIWPGPCGPRCRQTCSRAAHGISAILAGQISPAAFTAPVRCKQECVELMDAFWVSPG